MTAGEQIGYQVLLARTQTIHKPAEPPAYDCVNHIVVRDSGAILNNEFGQRSVRPGDVILLGANVLCGSEPKGHITVTAICLDTDYMLDQVRWQCAAFISDRRDAKGLSEVLDTGPAQILRLGEGRTGMLMPRLDELVALSVNRESMRHYLRIQALWFQIAYVIVLFIKVSPVRIPPSQRACIRPTLPRDRRSAPLRGEVRRAAALLRENTERRWTLEDLAAKVHLEPSQLSSVCKGVRQDPAGAPDDDPRQTLTRDLSDGDLRDAASALALPIPRRPTLPSARRYQPGTITARWVR